MTAYMKTKMSAPATGFAIEYVRKRKGSVQLDSICHPSQVATRRLRVLSLMKKAPVFVFWGERPFAPTVP
jgi:hypothetical protein